MGKTEAFDAERFCAFVERVELRLGSPVHSPERAEAHGWFRLGAPPEHAAISIQASRLIALPAMAA